MKTRPMSTTDLTREIAQTIVRKSDEIDAMRQERLHSAREFSIQGERMAAAIAVIEVLSEVFRNMTGEIPSITAVRQWAAIGERN